MKKYLIYVFCLLVNIAFAQDKSIKPKDKKMEEEE